MVRNDLFMKKSITIMSSCKSVKVSAFSHVRRATLETIGVQGE